MPEATPGKPTLLIIYRRRSFLPKYIPACQYDGQVRRNGGALSRRGLKSCIDAWAATVDDSVARY